MGKGKARIIPVVLVWNWKYQNELMTLNIYTQRGGETDLVLCVCALARFLILLIESRSNDTPVAIAHQHPDFGF